MEERKQKNVKGVRIRSVNLVMIIMSCILYVLLIAASFLVLRQYQEVAASINDYIECEQSDALLTGGSAYLTEQARLYVVTAKIKYLENYFEEAHTGRRREQALEELGKTHGGEESYQFLVEALEGSNKLMERDLYAMRLIAEISGADPSALPEEMRAVELLPEHMRLSQDRIAAVASEMVFGEAYHSAQAEVEGNVEASISSIREMTYQRMLDSEASLKKTMTAQQVLISVLFVETLITFVMIIMLIIKPLHVYVNCIKEDKMMEIVGSYEFRYLALSYNDIYEINTANEVMLRHQAEHDPLTGIINRGAFENLKTALAVNQCPMALLMIDVDKFKQVNDGWGHEMGDQILKTVARMLEENFRNTDYPARIGGDEFAVIMTDISEDQKPVIERKIAAMNEELTHPREGVPAVSLSVGGAFSPKGFSEDLVKKADQALYDVKEHGRCGCRFYQEPQQENQ